MRALVTGCAGFIGSHLTERLLGDGADVLGIDCFNDNYGRRQKLENLSHFLDADEFEFIPLDLSRGDLREFVEQVDIVFHLAAEPGVRSSWGSRFQNYIQNNVQATQHLLEAAVHAPDVRFVYASSSSVYGQAKEFPTSESAMPEPNSPYGATKLAGEHLCQLYQRNFGVDTVSLRFFSVYGPRQRPDMAFHIFCRRALARQPITIYGDGTQTRDFTYVADVIEATRLAGTTPGIGGSILNIGGGSSVSLREAVEHIEALVGYEIEATYGSTESGDVRDTQADTALALEKLKFVPTTPWQEGLAAEFEWTSALGRLVS